MKRQVDVNLKQKIKRRTQKGWGYARIINDLNISKKEKGFDLIHSYIHYCLSLTPERKAERKENTKTRRQERRKDKKRQEILRHIRQTRQFNIPDNLRQFI